MMTQILTLIIGITILIVGANSLVSGASSLAKKLNVSDLVIGLTIVSFGTSAPELVVNVFASYSGNDNIVFSNIIGSNNFNLFLILGLSGLIAPLKIKSNTVWRELPLSIATIILVLFLTNELFLNNKYGLIRIEGFLLLIIFGSYIYYIYKQLKLDTTKINRAPETSSNVKIGFYIIIGLIFLVMGGQMVVQGGIKLATSLGVSEKIIGLTIIAGGTSAPELATSIVAVIKKNHDIAVGNIIGSNIFNILLILSISSIISPLHYDKIFNIDFYLLLGGTVFLFVAMFTGEKKKLDRWEAGLLFITYITVITYHVATEIR